MLHLLLLYRYLSFGSRLEDTPEKQSSCLKMALCSSRSRSVVCISKQGNYLFFKPLLLCVKMLIWFTVYLRWALVVLVCRCRPLCIRGSTILVIPICDVNEGHLHQKNVYSHNEPLYKCMAIALVSVRPLLLLDILTLHVKKPCLFMSHLTRCMEELVKTFDRV